MVRSPQKPPGRSQVPSVGFADVRTAIIEHDFKVGLIGEEDGSAIFGAVRKDHYHFVVHLEGREGNIIRQHHIPRYRVAVVARRLKGLEFPDGSVYRPAEITKDSGKARLGLAQTDEKKLAVVVHQKPFVISAPEQPIGIVYRLDTEAGVKLARQISLDVNRLARAEKDVRMQKGVYSLEAVKTPSGTPVASEVREIVEAIAFEQQLVKILDASRFGLFSAFSTFSLPRTGLVNAVLSDIWNMLRNRDFYTSDQEYSEIAKGLIRHLLPRQYWGLDYVTPSNKLTRAIDERIKKMNPSEIALLTLMFGMHDAEAFLALSVACNITDFDKYADLVSKSRQPDSREEQELRLEASFMELFRDLMSARRPKARTTKDTE